jgi:NTE family protein
MFSRINKIENLGLSGGGFYGYAEVAALKKLEEYSEHFNIKNIKGVSVGSIVAALYAVGYTPDELTDILFAMDFDKLIRDTRFVYFKLWDKYGMYEAKELENEIEKLISLKTNIKLCTFSQINMNLTIISTNLNYQCARFFNRDNTPEIPISKAVRLSIGYPLIMTPVLFEGDYYGDGGEFMNYPITTFDDKDLDKTLGITFAAYNENNNGTLKSRIPINDIYDYIRSLGSTLSRSAYVSQVTEKYLDRSIVVNVTDHISSMQFNLTMEQKKFIYNCGIKAVENQISKILGVNYGVNYDVLNIQNKLEHSFELAMVKEQDDNDNVTKEDIKHLPTIKM